MRGALRFLLHLAQHLAASQHWAHFALGFLRLFGHTLNVNNFLAGAEREESLKFFLFSFFLFLILRTTRSQRVYSTTFTV